MRNYQDDFIDGEYVSPLIITEDYILFGEHRGSVHIESGEFVLSGTLNGSLNVQGGASARILGKQRGSVSIHSQALVIVEGSIEGSTSLQPDGTLIVETNAKLAGSLNNFGRVILKGVFGGTSTGRGEIIVEDSGYIKQPIIKDGVSYYNW
ncbi:hypothetical protein ACFVS2_26555 [Brevibacillus sp. NPDC058079]|uniref:hypothetical protein n=1 Tax=Brevibacillus sp. NPDC058079 TaxID=3346330 RepID=UPI0036EA0734